MQVGDKIIEWAYVSWRGKSKWFREHTITKITPTGRIKTDRGIELDEHLKLRGKHRKVYSTYFVKFNDEIKKEIEVQRMKDSIEEKVAKLDIHSLSEDELKQLLNLLTVVEKEKIEE